MPLSEAEIRNCISPRVLQLILMPTEACNFRCFYCYEDFKHTRMSRGVVRGVKGLLSRRVAGLDRISLTWFGGEPLLAADIMEEILVHARTLIRSHPSVELASDVTTNAFLLTRPMFERLLGLGVTDYQITFDGPRAWHDRRRVLAGGRGTFDRIWGNVAGMRAVSREFKVVVRLHVDQDNRETLTEFLDQYRDVFGDDDRFKLFFRPLSRMGGPNDGALRVIGDRDRESTLQDLRRLADARGIEYLTESHFARTCYAGHANSFVIRATGSVNKCTVALSHPNNQVGRIHDDGRLEIAPSLFQVWTRGLYSGDLEVLGCPAREFADSHRAS